MLGRMLWSVAPLQNVNYVRRDQRHYHPRLVQILQQHRGGTRVLLTAHILRSAGIAHAYADEVLEGFVILASIETRRRVDVLLEKGNCGSVGNLIGLNDIQIVVSLDLLAKPIPTSQL